LKLPISAGISSPNNQHQHRTLGIVLFSARNFLCFLRVRCPKAVLCYFLGPKSAALTALSRWMPRGSLASIHALNPCRGRGRQGHAGRHSVNSPVACTISRPLWEIGHCGRADSPTTGQYGKGAPARASTIKDCIHGRANRIIFIIMERGKVRGGRNLNIRSFHRLIVSEKRWNYSPFT